MPNGETHESVPAGATMAQTTVGVDPVAEPGFICLGVAVGILAAVLVGFVNNRLNPPPPPAQLAPPAAAPREPAPPPAPTGVEDATVPGSSTRRATPLAPTRYDEVSPHDVSAEAISVVPTYVPPEQVAPPPEVGLFARLRDAMTRSRAVLQDRFDTLFGRPVDESLFEELEEALLTADVGVPAAERIVDKVRVAAKNGAPEPAKLREAMRSEMRAILSGVHAPLVAPQASPWVILVVGVNGSGKTTTIGKLAARFARQGKRVMLAAGDTYRAAAADQLKVWAERAEVDIVAKEEGADPGAVVFEALSSATRQGHDVVIIDTAGRLQTRKPLMDQLGKIRRVITKHVPDAPHETLLVLDGTMGQNGISQARLFHEATPLTGVAVTKLDGTAKGGMILTIAAEMQLPVKLIGIGEGVDDLRDFEVDAFVDALA